MACRMALRYPSFACCTANRTAHRKKRLFNEGKTLFLRQDYASARQALTHYVKLEKQSDLLDEANYMLACTTYELQMPNHIQTLSDYLEAHPESRYANRIQSFIASSYFFEGKYMEAIANFKDATLNSLPTRNETIVRCGLLLLI